MSQLSKLMWQGFALLVMGIGLFFWSLGIYESNPESIVLALFMGLDIVFMFIIVGLLLWLASSI